MKIIYVHIPKTAGSTFSSMLEKGNKVKVSMGHRVKMYTHPKEWVNIKMSEQELYEQYNIVRGHFPYQRLHYLKKHGWNLITWVRDPIERLISHYSVFMYGAKKIRPEVENIIRGMDIVEFGKFLNNFSTRFTGEDPSIFDFIGTVEEFDKSVATFNEQFDCNLKFVQRYKVTKNKKEVSPKIREELKQHLLKDYEFYEKVVERYK